MINNENKVKIVYYKSSNSGNSEVILYLPTNYTEAEIINAADNEIVSQLNAFDDEATEIAEAGCEIIYL